VVAPWWRTELRRLQSFEQRRLRPFERQQQRQRLVRAFFGRLQLELRRIIEDVERLQSRQRRLGDAVTRLFAIATRDR